MPQFIINYVGGTPPATPEEGQQHMARYKQWLAELGNCAIQPATPLKNTHNIAPDGKISNGGITGISGYTLIETASMEEALVIAKRCPFLEIGGSLEVAELGTMPG